MQPPRIGTGQPRVDSHRVMMDQLRTVLLYDDVKVMLKWDLSSGLVMRSMIII